MYSFLQRNGGSIGEEIMENTDVGEHEDVDVKNERQKVFNLITTSAVQEPPVVLVQVKSFRIYLDILISYFHFNI